MSQQHTQPAQEKKLQKTDLSDLFVNKATIKLIDDLETKSIQPKAKIGIRGSKKLLKNIKAKSKKNKETVSSDSSNLKKDYEKEDSQSQSQDDTDVKSSKSKLPQNLEKNSPQQQQKQTSNSNKSHSSFSPLGLNNPIGSKSLFQPKNLNPDMKDKSNIVDTNSTNSIFPFTSSNSNKPFSFSGMKPFTFGDSENKTILEPVKTQSVPIFAGKTMQMKNNLFTFNTNLDCLPKNYFEINLPKQKVKEQPPKVTTKFEFQPEKKEKDGKKIKIKGEEYFFSYSKNPKLKDSIVVCVAQRQEFLGNSKRQMKISYYNNFVAESAAPMESLVMQARPESIENYSNLKNKSNPISVFLPTIIIHSKDLFQKQPSPLCQLSLEKKEVKQKELKKDDQAEAPKLEIFSQNFLSMLNQKSKLIQLGKEVNQKNSKDYKQTRLKILDMKKNQKTEENIDQSKKSEPLFGKSNLKFQFTPSNNSKNFFQGFI